MRQEYRGVTPHRMDLLLCCWLAAGAVIYVLREQTVSAAINRAGWIFDGAGLYFLFRCLVRNWEDIIGVGLALTIIAIPVAAIFSWRIDGTKPLRLFRWSKPHHAPSRGQAPLLWGVSASDHGRHLLGRCCTAHRHAVVDNPLRRPLVATGAGCAIAIVVLTASSGPLASLAVVFVMAALYRFRRYAWWMLAGSVLLLTGLHLVMNKPVWHLFARMDLVGGSTGYHRYKLIDAFSTTPTAGLSLAAKTRPILQ
jgi:hypothetical protein